MDIMDILMLMDIWDIGAERGGLLKLNLLLILRLILIFSMVDTMDMVMDYTEDIMDTLMLTGVNVEECQLNIKILLGLLILTKNKRRPLQPQWTCLCPAACL